jgi:hypothetical protein
MQVHAVLHQFQYSNLDSNVTFIVWANGLFISQLDHLELPVGNATLIELQFSLLPED